MRGPLSLPSLKSANICKTTVIDPKTWKCLTRVAYTELEKQYGYSYYLYHRVDLHNGLKALALEANPGENEAILHLSSEVTEIDCENGTLTTRDGTKYSKDLLIVADGVHVSVWRLLLSFRCSQGSLSICTVEVRKPHQLQKGRCRVYGNVFIQMADTKNQTSRESLDKRICQ